MADKYHVRVQEIFHRKGDKISEVEYVYDEVRSKNKINRRCITIKRETFEDVAATVHKPRISFDDFTKVTRPLLLGHDAIADIPEAFQILDTDHSETIEISELAAYMPAIVPGSNPYMLLRYFQVADTNSDHRLSLEEFTDFIKKDVIRNLALGNAVI